MKWGWLLGAVALAGFLVARYKRLERWLQIAGWIAVAGAAAVGTGLVELPNLEELLSDAGRMLGEWTYLLVGVLAFLETGAFVGFIAPGETAVIVGGVVAGQGEISLAVLIAIVWACAVAGDTTSFFLGRRLGRDWLLRHGARLKITDDRLKQVEGFFERRGGADDPGRPLPRLRPSAGAVPRGRGADAAAALPALRRPRRRVVDRDVRDARLRLLALVRPAHHVRVARSVRVRDGRRDRRAAGLARAAAPQSGDARSACRRGRTSAATNRAGAMSSASAGRCGGLSVGRRRAAPTSPRGSAGHG